MQNFEEYIEEKCKNFPKATIVYHIEKPLIAEGFSYKEMEDKFDNEMLIEFPTNTNNIIDFIDCLNDFKIEYDCIEHFGNEIMTEYDTLHIWW